MSQSLFSLAKIGVFLDGFAPGQEERHGEDTKIVTLTLRVQPFDVKHAIAIDEGLGEDSNVRQALFNLSNDEPKAHLERVNLSLGCPPQTLRVHAAPDAAEPRIVFTQVKITGTYARTQKDVDGYAFVFKASFGPVGRDEWEYLNHWFLSQQFVTFEAAEPLLDADAGDDLDVRVPKRPAPMWDDGERPTAMASTSEGAPPLPVKRGRKKTGRHNPEQEAAAQVDAGREAAADDVHEATA